MIHSEAIRSANNDLSSSLSQNGIEHDRLRDVSVSVLGYLICVPSVDGFSSLGSAMVTSRGWRTGWSMSSWYPGNRRCHRASTWAHCCTSCRALRLRPLPWSIPIPTSTTVGSYSIPAVHLRCTVAIYNCFLESVSDARVKEWVSEFAPAPQRPLEPRPLTPSWAEEFQHEPDAHARQWSAISLSCDSRVMSGDCLQGRGVCAHGRGEMVVYGGGSCDCHITANLSI